VKVAIKLPTSHRVGEEAKKKPTTYQVYGKPCIDRLSRFVDNMSRVLLESRKQTTTRGPKVKSPLSSRSRRAQYARHISGLASCGNDGSEKLSLHFEHTKKRIIRVSFRFDWSWKYTASSL